MREGNEDDQNSKLVTKDDFTSFDYEEPITGFDSVGYFDLSERYSKARQIAEAAGDAVAAKVYALLFTICRFHFKPEDRGEPYGPMFVSGDGYRTAIPSDFKGDQAAIFGQVAELTKNPALRARLADIASINLPRDRQSKMNTIRGLNESVRLVLDGKASFDGGKPENHVWLGVEYLQRALVIGRMRGSDPEPVGETKDLLVRMRQEGFASKTSSIFGRAAKLDLYYGISDVAGIAREAAEFAIHDANKGDQEGARRNWLIAAQAHEITRDGAANASCLNEVAECHVRDAEAMAASAMNATGSLMRAIEQYRQVPREHRPPGRIEQLQAKLVAKQAELHDEMNTFEHSEDITDHVNRVMDAYSGKPLADCLYGLALIENIHGIEHYRAEIKAQSEEFVFASVIDSTVHDDEGKVVARIPALSMTGEITDDDVRARCSQIMTFEHQASVKGAIRPAIHVINSEHAVGNDLFMLLARLSFFVPPGHEAAYAVGLNRFFAGSNMEACCLLVPQLENSLRYVLKRIGLDVTKITNSSTQEDVMLSILLSKFREPLEKLYGANTIFQVEMIFQSRAGFNIRNSIAHGTTSDNDFWSFTHSYGCWLIYRMLMAPLIKNWEQVKLVLEKEGYV
ncbi:DUF4209 domain-containing protein [Methylorubrum extorquens]